MQFTVCFNVDAMVSLQKDSINIGHDVVSTLYIGTISRHLRLRTEYMY